MKNSGKISEYCYIRLLFHIQIRIYAATGRRLVAKVGHVQLLRPRRK